MKYLYFWKIFSYFLCILYFWEAFNGIYKEKIKEYKKSIKIVSPYLTAPYGEKVKAYLRRGARALPGFTEYLNPQAGYRALCVENSLPV